MINGVQHDVFARRFLYAGARTILLSRKRFSDL